MQCAYITVSSVKLEAKSSGDMKCTRLKKWLRRFKHTHNTEHAMKMLHGLPGSLLYFLSFSSYLHLPHFICSVHSVSLEILSPPLPPNSVIHPLTKTHTQSGRGRRLTPSHTSLRYTCADVCAKTICPLVKRWFVNVHHMDVHECMYRYS